MKDILRYVALAGVFFLPFLPLVVVNSLFFPYITGKNFILRIVVEIMFVAWALLALYEPRYRPRFSFLIVALFAWAGIVLAADIAGISPLKSLWSNFERMEGFVAIAHLVVYIFVAGNLLNTQKLWDYFFNTTLCAASLVMLYAFAQLGGAIVINQGGDRVDATLGNAAYFAIYMLFHVFFAIYMLVRAKEGWQKVVYGILAVAFAGLLIQTATRGTTLGLVGGGITASLYLALFGRGGAYRTWSIGVLAGLVILIGGFISIRHTEFVKQNPVLARVANISLAAGETRFIIWGMALEGVKERPLLGWGQENFNYVFNKYYDPRLYGEEPWFDRVHNIVFDWLIAAGVLGLVSYFSVYFLALYYTAVRPIYERFRGRSGEGHFTLPEQGVLTGLLVGYMLHNFFVFDNLISYFFYGSVLALIYMRVSKESPNILRFSMSRQVVDQVAVPAGIVMLLVVLYTVNIPGLRAASGIIEGFQAKTPAAQVAAFEKAIALNSFGNQEIREQLTRVAQEGLQNQAATAETKALLQKVTSDELEKQVAATPHDARIRVFISSFYRVIGQPEKSVEQLKAALELSPKKQQIFFEQGLGYLQLGKKEEALASFKDAYELDMRYVNARLFYASGALYTGDQALFDSLITEEYRHHYYISDFILRSAYELKRYDLIEDILAYRIENDPKNLQLRVSSAAVYYENKDTKRAIETLEQAIKDFPEFKTQGEQYIAQLRTGNIPTQ